MNIGGDPIGILTRVIPLEKRDIRAESALSIQSLHEFSPFPDTVAIEVFGEAVNPKEGLRIAILFRQVGFAIPKNGIFYAMWVQRQI